MFFIETISSAINRWLDARRERKEQIKFDNEIFRRNFACGEKIHQFVMDTENAGLCKDTIFNDWYVSELDRFSLSYFYKFSVDEKLKVKVTLFFDDELAKRLDRPKDELFKDLTIYINGQKCHASIDDFEELTRAILAKLYDRFYQHIKNNHNAVEKWLSEHPDRKNID